MDACYEPVSGFRTSVRRLVYFTAPKWLVYLYLSALSLAYVVVIAHTPITIYATAAGDDALFMSLGHSLAEGRWLGPYSSATLIKAPGYPAFLALVNWLGLPVSVGHALLFCVAVLFFATVAHRIMKSHLLSGILFALLLWTMHPTTAWLDRILREQIYGSLTLALFAAAIAALFLARATRQLILLGALTGFLLGWLWLTREEGAWILPAAVLLVGAAIYRAYRLRRLRDLVKTLIAMIVVFASIQVGFRTVNLIAYGKFVGVEVKEANFERAMRAIDSVHSGGTKAFVSITHAAMKRVDAVSPAFASLAPYFNGPGKGWETFTCSLYPSACGEIGSGWFVWALRGAAEMTGHYSSPAEASAFYGQIADEISAACGRGALTCDPQLIAEMPPVNWSDALARVPALYGRAWSFLLMINPPLQFNPSTGTEAQLRAALAFLNYPKRTPSVDGYSTTYTLSGWYFKSGSKWFWPTVLLPNGSAVEVRFDRQFSRDIQSAFKDPEASHQRFTISARCGDDCTLRLESQDGETVEKKLAEFHHGKFSFTLGKGSVYIDIAKVEADPEAAPLLADVAFRNVRRAILENYAFLSIPILALGAIAFVAAALIYWRVVLTKVSFIIALSAWTLVLSRTSLLVLIAATSFPAMNPTYLWPGQILLVIGAVFFCAALQQLWLGVERQGTVPTVTNIGDLSVTPKNQGHGVGAGGSNA